MVVFIVMFIHCNCIEHRRNAGRKKKSIGKNVVSRESNNYKKAHASQKNKKSNDRISKLRRRE